MMPLGVLGWAFVGLVVAVIEKRLNAGRDPAGGRVTVLCIAGAVAGGFLGQALHPYAFGLPLGFVFAAAGAKVLLSLSRSRGLPTCVGADTTQRRSAASSVGIGLLEVVGWGGLGSVALGIAGYLGLLLGLTLWHPQQYSQFPVAFLLIPFGWFVGLVLTPVVRLARPRWTTAHMLFVVLVLSISYAALMVGWGKAHAQEANIRITLLPDHRTRAVACSAASCPAATPVTYHYRTTSGGSRLRVQVRLQFTDDNGHRRTTTASWLVE